MKVCTEKSEKEFEARKKRVKKTECERIWEETLNDKKRREGN